MRLAVAGAKCRLPFTPPATDPKCSGAVSGKDSSKPGNAPVVSKRGRNDDTISPVVGRQAKRLKFAEKVKESLRVAIVDYGNTERKLSSNQWELVEQRILDGVNDAIVKAESRPPLFGQLSTFKGFKTIECDNKETLDWLKGFIANMNAPWSNADLRVVDKKEILEMTRPKGIIHMRGPYLPVERIERNLQFLNPELQSREWKVLETGEYTQNGMDVTIQLSHKSLPLLRKQEFKVRVGITRCKLRLLAVKDKGEQPTTRDEDNTTKSSSQ